MDCVHANSSPTTYNFQIRTEFESFSKARTDSKSKTTKYNVILVEVHKSMNLSLQNSNF